MVIHRNAQQVFLHLIQTCHCIEPRLFTAFVQHMTSDEALLYWTVHDDKHDIFIMNDMDAQTGTVKPASVVHVWRHQLYQCKVLLHMPNISACTKSSFM